MLTNSVTRQELTPCLLIRVRKKPALTELCPCAADISVKAVHAEIRVGLNSFTGRCKRYIANGQLGPCTACYKTVFAPCWLIGQTVSFVGATSQTCISRDSQVESQGTSEGSCKRRLCSLACSGRAIASSIIAGRARLYRQDLRGCKDRRASVTAHVRFCASTPD